MMKALEKLVASRANARVGNHAVKHYGRMEGFTAHFCKVMEGAERAFTYHGNIICMVDDSHRQIFLTHAGWYTPSTSRALNDYRRYFVDGRGYELVDED